MDQLSIPTDSLQYSDDLNSYFPSPANKQQPLKDRREIKFIDSGDLNVILDQS
jgi:hypothetical protein